MAGDFESVNFPADQPPKPRVRMFACPKCGASVTIRYPGNALSVTCPSCKSIVDATDPNYRIISASKARAFFTPLIPLGSRGEIFGRHWEVIGFLVRNDVASHFMWYEYLLFNPYYGYRWLTQILGHWSFVTPIKQIPDSATYSTSYAVLDNVSYSLYSSGNAEVIYVLGEFYWKVKVGQSAFLSDFIQPPYMLSCEQEDIETVWSRSEYIEPAVVEKAFKLEKPLPTPTGVGANQPSKQKILASKVFYLFLLFFSILTVTEFWQVGKATSTTVLNAQYSFTPNIKNAELTTPVFILNKDSANIELSFQAPVDNSWVYISGELVNDKTGATYPIERSIEYYHGYDSDGAWSEGNTHQSLLISSVPGGQYYLNLDSESGSFIDSNPRPLTITVVRDVPTYGSYFWCLFLLAVYPAWLWWCSRTFEVSRWQNSDYSPYASEDSDD